MSATTCDSIDVVLPDWISSGYYEGDREIVLAAVGRHGAALGFATSDLKADQVETRVMIVLVYSRSFSV